MTDERIKEELKPCPFCGNETIRIWSGMDNEDKRSTYRVSCSSCGASGPYFKINTKDWGLEEVKTAWNTRAAERLAKIEVLELAKVSAGGCHFPWYVYDLLDIMISELKEAGE
jgi:Lar family restriction alleviation protein